MVVHRAGLAVALHEPTRVHRALDAAGPPATRLLVAVDQPDAFRQALLAQCGEEAP